MQSFHMSFNEEKLSLVHSEYFPYMLKKKKNAHCTSTCIVCLDRRGRLMMWLKV